MKVSKNKLTKAKVSNSQKTQTTELARQVPASAGPWRAKKGDPFGFLTSIVAKHQKIAGDPLGIFFRKSRTGKNWKGGPFGIFQYPFCHQASKN